MIIDFPNRFSEKKDILKDIPEEEYQMLAVKCVGILKDLLDKREFYKEGSIEQRMKKYEDHSDPLEKFIKEFKKSMEDGSNIKGYQLLMNRMKLDTVGKLKGQVGGLLKWIIGLGLGGIILYAILTGGGG